MKKKIEKIILTGLSCLALTAYGSSGKAPADLNMVVSLSSDGNYAIATNTNKQAILWNLKDHSYKIIFKDANIYSAYFIKNTNDFMYQNDATNEVVIENVNGDIIKTFNPGFPTFGEVATSDLRTYFASDRWFQLYKTNLTTNQTKQFYYYYCGPNYKDSIVPPTGAPYACDEFIGTGQLFNLSLTPDNKTLVAAEGGALYVWDVESTKLLKKVIANDEQTIAAINPDGSYVVTGDITSHAYFYDLINQNGFKFGWDTTPNNQVTASYFNSIDQNSINEILTVKFIDQNHTLAIFNGTPDPFNFAVLFNTDPTNMQYSAHWAQKVTQAIKYFPLIPNAATDTDYQKDWPLTSDDFSRDQAIDTSPSAHILVMSMAEKNGIIVYKYDPATQSLTREWAGEVSLWNSL